MPFTNKSNNRILPANSRIVDVAQRAIRDLTPIQQRRYANAFEVDGHEAVIYHRVSTGMPCSCQAHSKALATVLDQDGKMPLGTMNQLLTGGMEFVINRYGTRGGGRPDLREERGEDALPEGAEATQEKGLLPGARRLVDADYVTMDLDDDVATQVVVDRPVAQAVNGPVRAQTLEDLVGDFDADQELGDSSCFVCYGTGYVGGFAVLGGWRAALSTQWLPRAEVSGTIEANQTPHRFEATEVKFKIVLPKGLVYLDVFRVWNNLKQVYPDAVLIDGLAFSNTLFAALCDGLEHTITVQFDEITEWSHVEIQVCQSRHPSLIEFPKLQEGSDLSKLNGTEDVQLLASPLIPRLKRGDVVYDSVSGMHFVISSTETWNDKNKNMHGWSAQARVVQSAEMLSTLPRRRRLGQRPANAVRTNANGGPRT